MPQPQLTTKEYRDYTVSVYTTPAHTDDQGNFNLEQTW